MFCQKCGAEVKETEKFCHACGADLACEKNTSGVEYGSSIESKRRSRIAAGLLQIFLGTFGVGRFYLGYTGIAVGQLLLCIFTCGIAGIWPFIDGILILTGSPKCDAYGIPLAD